MNFKKTLTAVGLAIALLQPLSIQKADFLVPSSAQYHEQEQARTMELAGIIGFPIGFFQSAGFINSVQPFAIAIAGGAASNTATVNAVGAKASIVFGGIQCSNAAASDFTNDQCYLVQTSSTIITATRAATGAITTTVKGVIIDWKSAVIKSVQSGTIVIGSGSTSNTATITSVTTTNAVCFYLGNTTSTNGTTGTSAAKVVQTSATVITANRNTATTNTCTVGFFCLEFNSSVLNSSTQTGTITGVTGTPQTATITSVTTTATWLIYNGQTVTNSGNSYNEYGWITLTNGTTVTFTSGTAAIIGFSVCEFKTQNVKSNSYANVTTATASGTASFTAVNTSLAWVTYLGAICNTTTSSLALFDVVLTSTTVMTFERNTTPTSATAGAVMMELTG